MALRSQMTSSPLVRAATAERAVRIVAVTSFASGHPHRVIIWSFGIRSWVGASHHRFGSETSRLVRGLSSKRGSELKSSLADVFPSA